MKVQLREMQALIERTVLAEFLRHALQYKSQEKHATESTDITTSSTQDIVSEESESGESLEVLRPLMLALLEMGKLRVALQTYREGLLKAINSNIKMVSNSTLIIS